MSATEAYDLLRKGAYDDPERAGGTPIQTKEEARQVEIEDWVATALANANGPSFDPNKLIKGASFLKSDAERAYAYEVVKAMSSMR